MARLCECGCGQEIVPRPWHRRNPPRFIRYHHLRGQIEAFQERAAALPPSAEICACGCLKPIPYSPRHKYRPVRYINGHNHSARIAVQERYAKMRPEPLDCACGCGQKATVYRLRQMRYITGHNPVSQGTEHYNWKGGRVITRDGYVMLKMPGHHLADKANYVLEHRLVWEEANGRRLRPDEAVHHIDGVKDDNRPENLVALTNSEHQKIHGKRPRQKKRK